MLDYKLAKELRDAGFPHKYKEGNSYYVDENTIAYMHGNVYIPTLSELIEACGDRFCELIRLNKDAWVCEPDFVELPSDNNIIGKTPEEAVAKLWLKLNEKKK